MSLVSAHNLDGRACRYVLDSRDKRNQSNLPRSSVARTSYIFDSDALHSRASHVRF